MKKGTVLNSDISSVISRLGHTDTLVVCDAGLPIPKSTTRIDMALTQGVPSFMRVLDVCAAPGGKSFSAAFAMEDQIGRAHV